MNHVSDSPVSPLELPAESRGPAHSNLPGEARRAQAFGAERSPFQARRVQLAQRLSRADCPTLHHVRCRSAPPSVPRKTLQKRQKAQSCHSPDGGREEDEL